MSAMDILKTEAVSTAFKTLATYWQELRLHADSEVPHKKNFNPMRIRSILPNLLLLELPGNSVVKYRLTGTKIVEMFGFDPTGLTTEQYHQSISKQTAFHHQVVDLMAGQDVGFIFLRKLADDQGDWWRYVTLTFPLRSDEAGLTFGVQVGILTVPDELKDAHISVIQNRAKQFKIPDTTICGVIPIDVGYGRPDLPDGTSIGVVTEPWIMLQDIIEPA